MFFMVVQSVTDALASIYVQLDDILFPFVDLRWPDTVSDRLDVPTPLPRPLQSLLMQSAFKLCICSSS